MYISLLLLENGNNCVGMHVFENDIISCECVLITLHLRNTVFG